MWTWMLMSLSLVMVGCCCWRMMRFFTQRPKESLFASQNGRETQNTQGVEKKSREDDEDEQEEGRGEEGRELNSVVKCGSTKRSSVCSIYTLHTFALAFGCHFVLCLLCAITVLILWSHIFTLFNFSILFGLFCSLFCFIFFRIIIIWMAANTIKAMLIFSVNRKKNVFVSFQGGVFPWFALVWHGVVWFCVHSQSLCVFRRVNCNFSIYPSARESVSVCVCVYLYVCQRIACFWAMPMAETTQNKCNQSSVWCRSLKIFKHFLAHRNCRRTNIHAHWAPNIGGLLFANAIAMMMMMASLWNICCGMSFEWVTLRMPDKGAHNERFNLIELKCYSMPFQITIRIFSQTHTHTRTEGKRDMVNERNVSANHWAHAKCVGKGMNEWTNEWMCAQRRRSTFDLS